MQWFVPLLLIGLGILIKSGKIHWQIPGYHTDPQTESKADQKRLGRLVGNILFILAGISLAGSLLRYYNYKVLGDLTWVFFMGLIIYLVLRAQKYAQPESKAVAATSKSFLVILLLPLFMIFVVVAFGMIPNEFVAEEAVLTINGSYGAVIPYHQISTIQLLDEIPRVENKVKGYQLGNVEKGFFRLEGWGEGNLYLEAKGGPYLHIVYTANGEEEFLLMNRKEAEIVMNLYEQLMQK